MRGLRIAQVRVRARDQLETRDRGVDDQLAEIVDPLGDKVRQTGGRCRGTEQGVEIRTFEI